MHSLVRLDARGQNGKGGNAFDYFLATNALTGIAGYYGAEESAEVLRWGGRLAAVLGLEGQPVRKEDMLALGHGFSPADGTPLCRNAGAKPTKRIKLDRQGNPRLGEDGKPIELWEGGHRVGFDLTVSAPGDVSVAFAIADDREKAAILAAHTAAVQASLDFLESKVETRRGAQGKNVIGTQGLVYTQALHVSNRNNEPNLHTHNLIYGVAKGEDGQWGTYDAQEIYRWRQAADELYKAELYTRMKALGYQTERVREVNVQGEETGRVYARIAGIDLELCDLMKTRRQEVLDYARTHGVDNQTACLATRKQKEEPPFEALREDWARTLANIDREKPGLVHDTARIKAAPGMRLNARSAEETLQVLHRTEAVLCEHDLIRQLGMEHQGDLTARELLDRVERFKQEAGLVKLEGEKLAAEDRGHTLARRHRETRYAAPWMLDMEEEIQRRAKERQGENHWKMDGALVDRTVAKLEEQKGFRLSDEQRAVVRHITAESGGVVAMSGLAGTGKTTAVEFYKAAFEASRKQLFGVATANAAAQKLALESGMETSSVAMFLSRVRKGTLALGGDDVLVVDEAGMVESRDMVQLMAYAQKAGAKVVLQGDAEQIQPVGAGAGFTLVRDAIGDKKLTEIRRQKSEEDRHIAALFYDRDKAGKVVEMKRGTRSRAKSQEKGAMLLKRLDDRGCLDEFNTKDQAVSAVVKDYFDSPFGVRDRLILAHANAEVDALNEQVRHELRKRGEIDAEQHVVRTLRRGEWADLALSRRDRVRFSAGDADLGVVNGNEGVVEAIRPDAKGGFHVAVRLESEDPKQNGRVVRFHTSAYNAFQHNYALTIHKAQGQGKCDVFHLANVGMMDNHSSLVAFTRLTRGRYRLYGTSDDFEQLKDRLGLERLKENASDSRPLPRVQDAAQEILQAAESGARRAQVRKAKSDVPEHTQKGPRLTL
ncbi:MAG: relaxase domain-containing protein [Lysobacter sp.]|nr:relaxase domain-containing protein [Lysobacter sp.]